MSTEFKNKDPELFFSLKHESNEDFDIVLICTGERKFHRASLLQYNLETEPLVITGGRKSLVVERSNAMNRALELYDSHVSFIDLWDGNATIFFSHAYIHKAKDRPGRDTGSGWSQEAELILFDVTVTGTLPTRPNTISEGFLEVGGIKHELIPLPFKRKVAAVLFLEFVDGSVVEIAGQKPRLELLGRPTYLEDTPDQ